MEAGRYNGYSNYKTWATCLWLNNHESSYLYWMAAAEEAKANAAECPQVKEGIWTVERAPIYLLADRLKEQLSEDAPELGANLYADLLNASVSEIDWQEVAGEFLGDVITAEPVPARKFPLGVVVSTPGALEILDPSEIATALSRHSSGDWGECGAEDREENDLSLREGFRILSVYRTREGTRFWVITEADRTSTTVLLPEEY